MCPPNLHSLALAFGAIVFAIMTVCGSVAGEAGEVKATLHCPEGTVEVGVSVTSTGTATETTITRNHVCQQLPESQPETYKPSGNALIGGTGWIFGYNAPPGTDPEVLKRAQIIARRLAEEEGVPYNEKIAFQKYNFVLGVAASTQTLQDLGGRVIFDELNAGQYTAKTQELYNSLKGRQFDELACHSNGAMVCLAALENRHVKATHVVLFGPQITLESLKMWDDLVKSGRVQTLQIYINQGDPIPAASLLAGNLVTLAASPLIAGPLFHASVLKGVLGTVAPSAHVTTFACGDSPDVECHDLRRYKENRGDCAPSPARAVPGTSIPGQSGVIEPPPPC